MSFVATSSSTATSTLCDAKNQNQIFINVDIMGIDADQSSRSDGASATATGNPVPKVIVTSFNPKADSFEAAFSKAAESQSSATKASSEDDRRTNSNDPEVVDVENNCDVSNSKVSSWCESTESSCSSSDIDVVEVKVVSPPKSKKEVCVDTLLADLTGAFVDPLGEETLFGAVLTNYQNKLCQVEGSLQKIKQEEKKGETTLKLKTAKEKLLRKELDALRKEISEENRHLEELQKKKELMFTEKRSLQYKVLHCETLKSEHESKKARLK